MAFAFAFVSFLVPVNTARAQESHFSIDLGQVGKLYDTLYRDRVTEEVRLDSVIVFDYQHIPFGTVRYKVPHFLPSDFGTTRQVVDYVVIPDSRTTFTVPRTAFFEPTELQSGDLILTEPRDYTIPGLEIDIQSMQTVTDRIMDASRRQVWRESILASVASLQVTTESTTGGIKFDIPLPMPKSLESIFGPGEKTSITLRGREEITIAGETSVVDPFIGAEGRQKQSLFPSLDMQQQLDVSLTGTIGDKVAIQVDHSSEAVSTDANRVRLAYTGYEDEVIQLIELGNTSLSLPGSQLVSVSTNAQGLFGIKMLAKMGSTDFTMIASKQEGEVSSAQFTPTGGALGETEFREIRDVDYVANKYFYFDNPRAFIGPQAATIEVYRQRGDNEPAEGRLFGFAVPDPDGTGQAIRDVVNLLNAGGQPTNVVDDDFLLLTLGVDYTFIVDAVTDSIVGVELFQAISDNASQALAVSYVNIRDQVVGGSFSSLGVIDPTTNQVYTPTSVGGQKLLLEMLKAPDPDPRGIFGSTWDLMIRNIYNLGLNNIDGNSLEINIVDVLRPRLNPQYPDSTDVPYLQIFGLDQTDRSGTGPPDGRIDLTFGRVNLDAGLLQFPTIEPFIPDTSLVTDWTAGRFQFAGKFAAQYDTSRAIYNEKLNPTREAEVHQYLIQVRAVSTSKSFRINALNIVEQSENITLDGVKLQRGQDYDIDYGTGEVTLKDSALARITPDSKLSIDYQFKPLGGVGSSTLAGMSTASKFGENMRVGTTLLYESRATSTDRARLGEEPTRAIVGGVTFNYQHQSRVLTDIANWLPYVDSDQPSTSTFDAEIAGSLPNPNTKNEAYIDDFEGVEDTDRIGLARRSWYPASLPIEEDGNVKPDTSRVNFFWYNIEPEFGLHRRDLNPTLDEQENTLLQSLDIELDKTPAVGDTMQYAGVMLGFQGGGLDITQGQFLEIWVNDFKPDALTRGGKLHIDLGIIDENFFEPDTTVFNDEDKDRDGFAASFDDTGLDGHFDKDETVLLPGGTNDDKSGDDIDLSRINGRYSKVNGTEANLVYDTEDLDRNGQLGRVNAYFSYEIDLADTAEIDIRRQYPGYVGFTKAGHENDSWRLYRVKLSDHTVRTNSAIQPRLDEIRHARIWIDDLDQTVKDDGGVGNLRLQIAEVSIEGNRWEIDGVRNLSDGKRDNSPTEFAIGVISTKTDPGVYNPPVVPNQKNEVSDKESSLAMRYTNLGPATQIRILKRFLGAGLNMTLYRDLNFWVHTDSLRAGVEYYFRLGSNETNYYEVAVPFTSTLYNETGWSRVVLKLADLTNLKFNPVDSVVTSFATDIADPSHVYPIKMRGVPNLNGVRFLYAGVRNISNQNPQKGEIWMDDIYVGDVMRDFDHAERVSANLSVAGGAISLGGNWSRTGADYRGLRQTRGSGSDLTVLGLNAKTDLQYFVPLLGFSLPISGNYSRSTSRPKFPPNSDTEIIDPEVIDSLKTVRTTRGFNVSLARRSPSNHFLMRYTLDRLRPTFAYSDQRGSSPASRDTTTNMQGSLTYQMTWSGGNTIPLFGKNRFRFWINQLDLSTSATRQTGIRWSYINGEFRRDPYQYSASMRNQGTVRYNPFRSLETSFGIADTRDLAVDHFWNGYNIGTEIAYSNNARVSFVSPDTWWILRLFEKPSVEVQSSYSEDSGPNVRRENDPQGTRNVSGSRNDTGRIGFDLGKRFATVFRWVGWDVTSPQGGTRSGIVQGGNGAPNDSSRAAARPDTTKASRPGAGTLFRGVGRVLTSIRPIKANIQRRKNSSYLRVPDRPDWSYQFGLDNNTGILVDGRSIGSPDTKTSNLTYNLESGVQLLENLDVQGRYTQSITDSDFRTNQSRSTSTTWPDLQGRWGGLERLRVLDQSISQGELRVDWRQTQIETGPKDLPPITTTETSTLTPALVLTWKNQLSSSFNVSLTSNTSDTRGSTAVTDNTTIGVELKKTFRGGGAVKLFGKGIDWKNEMEATLQMAYARTGGERFQAGSTLAEPIPKTTALSIDPLVRYTFSKNINGSAFIGYARNFLETTGQTTTTVRMGVSAVINF